MIHNVVYYCNSPQAQWARSSNKYKIGGSGKVIGKVLQTRNQRNLNSKQKGKREKWRGKWHNKNELL